MMMRVPNKEQAQSYLESGDYLWSSGMFAFKASTFLNELESLQPDTLHHCHASLTKATHDLDFIRLDSESFEQCPGDSIDYAIMEQSKKVVTVPLKAENKLVALVGVDNVAVIETKDAVLVAAKDKVQDVKSIVYRPWGKYDVGDRFQVKRITVKAGESTSMQMHHHRAEHWIIVSGVAEVTCGEKTFLCTENQAAFIPQGSKHRIANPGKLPMEMIEVQTGSYLGEDDIVRFEDQYERTN